MSLPADQEPLRDIGTWSRSLPWPPGWQRLSEWEDPADARGDLVPGWVLGGMLNLIVGEQYLGKSALVQQIIAGAMRHGAEMLGEPIRQVTGPVLIYLTDYDHGQYKARLRAGGADLDRVITAPVPKGTVNWQADRNAAEASGVEVVVVDNYTTGLSGGLNTDSIEGSQAALEGVRCFLGDTFTVILVCHPGKSLAKAPRKTTPMGSTFLDALARARINLAQAKGGAFVLSLTTNDRPSQNRRVRRISDSGAIWFEIDDEAEAKAAITTAGGLISYAGVPLNDVALAVALDGPQGSIRAAGRTVARLYEGDADSGKRAVERALALGLLQKSEPGRGRAIRVFAP